MAERKAVAADEPPTWQGSQETMLRMPSREESEAIEIASRNVARAVAALARSLEASAMAVLVARYRKDYDDNLSMFHKQAHSLLAEQGL